MISFESFRVMRLPRVRFTLRWVMLLVLVVGCWLGWRINKARRQAIAVAAVQRLNGSMVFDEDKDAQGRYRPKTRPPRGPQWLRRVIGPEFFRTLETVWVYRRVGDDELVFLQGLSELRTIHLARTDVTDKGLNCLGSMPRLWGVDLMYCVNVTDATAPNISRLTDLKELYLNGTQFTDAGLACVRGKQKLRTLFLHGTRVTDAGLRHLQGLDELQSLGLSETQVTDAGLVFVKEFKKLRQLGLEKTTVTDAGLAQIEGLTELYELVLKDTDVTDAGLVHLKGLTRLDSLYLDRTRVTKAGVDDLQKALPNAKISRGP